MEGVGGNILLYAVHSSRQIPAEQVRNLYDHAAWWPDRTVEEIGDILEAASAVGVWDGERLIGFARAVRDMHFRAYIEDVVVHTDYGHQDMASRMLSLLLQELADVGVVSLFCDPEGASLYEAHGFHRSRQTVMRLQPAHHAFR